MSRIFITGDTHGDIDISKLSTKHFVEQKNLTKEDFVIVAGDFGAIWGGGKQDKWLQKWYLGKSFTTLFVDGNHENHDLINKYPISEWNGGKVQFINDSIIHLMRGEVYNIGGYKIFVFGGAESHDKERRTSNISWWAEEIPSWKEFNHGLETLDSTEVDIIITHEAPYSIIQSIGGTWISENVVSKYLQQIWETYHFERWFCGHHHIDKAVGTLNFLYDEIIELPQKKHLTINS